MEHTEPPFLTDADRALLARHLRGVRMITLRQFGGSLEIAAEVLSHLEERGFAVTFRQIERMSPPPLLRIAFRYPGPRQAEMTIAPDLRC